MVIFYHIYLIITVISSGREYYVIDSFELCYKMFYYRDITLLHAGRLLDGINVFDGNTLQIRVYHTRT